MVVELVAEKPVLCGMKCVLSMLLRNYTSVSSSSTFCCRPFAEFRWCCFRGSKASTIICSVPFISARQKGHPYIGKNKKIVEWKWFIFIRILESKMFEICWNYCIIDEYLKFIHNNLHSKDDAIVHTCPSESTCHDVRHGVQSKWPQGSILISLSFSAHILHNWNVLPTNAIKFKTKKHR